MAQVVDCLLSKHKNCQKKKKKKNTNQWQKTVIISGLYHETLLIFPKRESVVEGFSGS
jgi:hypothetical protein